ncbi:aromatic ring-hydroxylating oxygenase subunit alpha [Eoetvoesiella caeni]
MAHTPSVAQRSSSKLDCLRDSWDLGAATHAEIFQDQDVYDLEMERIFHGPSWHVVGHVCEFMVDGAYKLHRIGRTPLIVTRSDGAINILVNSCAHRGAQVVRGDRGVADRKAAFTCIYHQWTFDLAGNTVGVGLRQGYGENFPMSDYRLARVKTAIVGGVIFASLGKNPPPIEDYLGARVVAHYERMYGSGDLVYLGVQRAVWACNWKLYVENIYDSYHAVTLHKGFRMMRIKKPAPQLEDPAIVKYGHYLSVFEAESPERTGLENPEIFEMRSRQDGLSGHVLTNVFPASQVTELVDVPTIRTLVPKSPETTEIRFNIFGREGDSPEMRRHRLWQAANFLGPQGLINLEDATALGRVQTAMQGRSRGLDNAHSVRFPERRVDEKAIDSFYRAYFDALFGETGEDQA